MRAVRKVADENGIMIVLDISLVCENMYFIKMREPEFMDKSPAEILRTLCDLSDVIYFSARKISCSRGGGIATKNKELYLKMRDMIPLFEGFLTYGGISVREIESMAVGMREAVDWNVIRHSPEFIKYLVDSLDKKGIPVITPARWPRLPSGCQRIPASSDFFRLSCRRFGCCLVYRFRCPWYGTWYDFDGTVTNRVMTYRLKLNCCVSLFHAVYSPCLRSSMRKTVLNGWWKNRELIGV